MKVDSLPMFVYVLDDVELPIEPNQTVKLA